MKGILIIMFLLCCLGCKQKEAPEPADHFLRVLSFPTVPLDAGERISGLEIKMTCGRFRSVNNVPNDWSLEIKGPVSERSTLEADANHGTSYLSNFSNLQDFATILVCSTSQFDITATIFTEMSDKEEKKIFRKEQLKLEKCPTSHSVACSKP